MNPHETRCLDLAAAEVRAEQLEDGRPVVRGVAIRYGSLSRPMKDAKGRPFRERFRAGAFSRALATGADVRMLVNHDKNIVMGRNTAGTLELFDDPDALRFVVYPPPTPIMDHYRESIRRGDMSGVSFRFYKKQDLWTGAGDATVRDVTEADIDDISVVTYPAFDDTEAVTRSLDDHCRSQPGRPDPRLLRAAVRLRLAESE